MKTNDCNCGCADCSGKYATKSGAAGQQLAHELHGLTIDPGRTMAQQADQLRAQAAQMKQDPVSRLLRKTLDMVLPK
ncbi:hypothetical protein Nazgul15 [Burkholderia phage BcepNazgul]|uniref:Uncharacterized protein n=1 Tax=Burkholderia phage BcepNazgul TaxID=242861 RepID=Q6UYF0_9CAUD|nr:hypothetical protein Nazgul15 [Burkholderia phage BcepNazgul]AAQ63391.1 hypothetical protein Nazgul15 [Burkholderia phage BcepNazgul]